MDVAAMSTLWKPLQATIRIPVLVIAGLIGGLVFLGATAGPAPVTAAPFTCRISKTFTIPTMAELTEKYGGVRTSATSPDPEVSIPSQFSFVAGVDSRCRRNITKGLYAYRMKVTVSTQLSTRWPEDISEYPQGVDSAFMIFPVYTQYSPDYESDLSDFGSPVTVWRGDGGYRQLNEGQVGSLGPLGTSNSPLTELCVGERCSFTSEHGGTFFQPTTGGDFGLELFVDNACAPIVPVDLAATILCRDAELWDGGQPAYYFHPGLSGARFTVNATFLFEPLMTWRQ